jgi:hypothetical protein
MFLSKCSNVEILKNIVKLCDIWENHLIYANNFMNLVRTIVNNKVSPFSDFRSRKVEKVGI